MYFFSNILNGNHTSFCFYGGYANLFGRECNTVPLYLPTHEVLGIQSQLMVMLECICKVGNDFILLAKYRPLERGIFVKNLKFCHGQQGHLGMYLADFAVTGYNVLIQLVQVPCLEGIQGWTAVQAGKQNSFLLQGRTCS